MERTEEGKLATELKEKEREINQIGRKKIKVVEINGAQLQSILTQANPLEQPHCMRQEARGRRVIKDDSSVTQDCLLYTSPSPRD